MATLLFVSGPDRGKVYPVAGGTHTLGRLLGCDVPVSDEKVSREHCRLWFDHHHKTYLLADLGSTDGTRINGDLIRRESVLAHGDEITVGQSVIRFCRHTPVWDPADFGGVFEQRSVRIEERWS